MQIIGISGKKQSGKDTLAELLILASALPTERHGFADALKKEVAIACGVTTVFIETNKAVFRPILQWWGTDFRRRYDGDDYWVIHLYDRIKSANDYGIKLVIVSDVRFKSEFDALTKLNAYMVRIARPSQITDDKHVSETDLDNCNDFNQIVLNNGTKDDLMVEARTILTKFRIPTKA